MLPILLSVGPVKIYSYGVCLAIGLFISLYFWWKMGRDEHWDEINLFDGFFLAVIAFAVVGRLGYVILHPEAVGTFSRAFAILAYPGINAPLGIATSVGLMIYFARAHNWQEWKMLDALAVTLLSILIMAGVGSMLNGSRGSWQGDLWAVLWAIASFAIVSRVRKNFRFYSWYKGEASVAQEGLASLVFGLLIGIYYLVAPWIVQDSWLIWRLPGQFVLGVLGVAGSIYLIQQRVGRREMGIWDKLKSILGRS